MILCIVKGKMPFKMQKIIIFSEKKNNEKKICVPSLPKIFRNGYPNHTYFFYLALSECQDQTRSDPPNVWPALDLNCLQRYTLSVADACRWRVMLVTRWQIISQKNIGNATFWEISFISSVLCCKYVYFLIRKYACKHKQCGLRPEPTNYKLQQKLAVENVRPSNRALCNRWKMLMTVAPAGDQTRSTGSDIKLSTMSSSKSACTARPDTSAILHN